MQNPFSALLSPASIGSLELKNRLIVPPMVTCFSDGDFRVSARELAHLREKAQGGWGLIITQAQLVSKKGVGFRFNLGIFSDEFLDGQRQLTAAVHAAGGRLCAQLIHSGRQSIYFQDHKLAVAPSPIKDFTLKYTPREMTPEEIREAIDDFAAAAARAKQAGYDAVEIHGAHGYLLHEFVSMASNRRTDEYGGSLQGRTRFPLAVVRAVRAAVGPDFPVIYRMSTSECLPHGEGITVEDSMAFALMLEQAGVDAIHSSAGNYETERYQIAPAAVERAVTSPFSAQLKRVVGIPVICAGKFTDPYMAEAMLRAGRCDFVAMGRQSLADPDLPRKLQQGRCDELRHCIGCQLGCLMRLKADAPITCTINPRIGFEAQYPQTPAAVKKQVLVIGGGIAGMQAAITAAERGHTVTLCEKSDRLGGQWNYAAMPPYKQELAGFVVWQKQRLAALGVTVRLNTLLTDREIIDFGADDVILATGAQPVVPQLPGVSRENVHTFFDVLSGAAIVSGKTAIIGGGSAGCETAAFLAMTNQPVVLFLAQETLRLNMEPGAAHFLKQYLQSHSVELIFGATVREIRADSIVYEQNGRVMEYGPISDTVLALGTRPDAAQAQTLAQAVRLHVVGDAARIGRGLVAVHSAFAAAYRL